MSNQITNRSLGKGYAPTVTVIESLTLLPKSFTQTMESKSRYGEDAIGLGSDRPFFILQNPLKMILVVSSVSSKNPPRFIDTFILNVEGLENLLIIKLS